MSSPSDDASRASREQQAWESIVADLSGQIEIPSEIPSEFPSEAPGEIPAPSMADRDAAFIDALLDDGQQVDFDEADPPHSYTPPDPGPIQLPADAISRAAWAGAIAGPIVVMAAFLLGLGTFVAGIGVAAFIGGFVTLIVRLPDRDPGEDDGAVV